jgi:hypothetical protein
MARGRLPAKIPLRHRDILHCRRPLGAVGKSADAFVGLLTAPYQTEGPMRLPIIVAARSAAMNFSKAVVKLINYLCLSKSHSSENSRFVPDLRPLACIKPGEAPPGERTSLAVHRDKPRGATAPLLFVISSGVVAYIVRPRKPPPSGFPSPTQPDFLRSIKIPE